MTVVNLLVKLTLFASQMLCYPDNRPPPRYPANIWPDIEVCLGCKNMTTYSLSTLQGIQDCRKMSLSEIRSCRNSVMSEILACRKLYCRKYVHVETTSCRKTVCRNVDCRKRRSSNYRKTFTTVRFRFEFRHQLMSRFYTQ